MNRTQIYLDAREVELLDRAGPCYGSIDTTIARTAALFARRYRRSHTGIDDADYLIAATAVVADAELLTTNVRHFPMLRGLSTPY